MTTQEHCYTEDDLRLVIKLWEFAYHVNVNSVPEGYYPLPADRWDETLKANAANLARFAGLLPEFDVALAHLQATRQRQEYAKRAVANRRGLRKDYAQVFMSLIRRDGYACAYCGSTAKNLVIDHIIPLAAGGSNDWGNLQILCRACNSRKSDHLEVTWHADDFSAPR